MKELLTTLMIIISFNVHAQTIKGDTLNVSNPKINFIKVDGILYQLKRTTTLEKVEINRLSFRAWQPTTDTSSSYNLRLYNQGSIVQPLLYSKP